MLPINAECAYSQPQKKRWKIEIQAVAQRILLESR